MREIAKNYYHDLLSLVKSITVTNKKGKVVDFYEGIEKAAKLVMKQTRAGHKIIFIGNGASAAISSHMSTDFWKNGGMRTTVFNDSSLLTCVSNDYGYQYVFEKPIKMFADPGDLLIAISSSGQSENILLGVKAAALKKARVITLSGFDRNNHLRRMGEINFYVSSPRYGHVEIMHHSICHCLLDTIIQRKSLLSKRGKSK